MTETKTKRALSPQGKPYEELAHFVNADGKHLFCRCWEPPAGVQARAVALIVHGAGEHCGRYDPVAEVLVAKGICTYAHDHIGHGQSEGIRIDVTDFNLYIRDVLQHVDTIKEKHPGLPIFLIGHSMGGTIAVLTMNKKPKDFAGCVLIGAIIQPNPVEITPFKVFLAKASAYLLPQLGIGNLDPKCISRQPEEVEDYATDPLVYHGKLKARFSIQVLKAMNNVVSSFEDIEWPVLILHGEEDRLSLVDGSKLMHEKIKSKDKTLKIYPGHYHVIHREIPSDAAIVKQDIVSWIEERIDRKPDVESNIEKEGTGAEATEDNGKETNDKEATETKEEETKENENIEEVKDKETTLNDVETAGKIDVTVEETTEDSSEIKSDDKIIDDVAENKNEE